MRPAYENALPGNCKGCGKPGADIRRKTWHQTCWDLYREGSNYREAAERREGQHQRCIVCKRVSGELVTVDGKLTRIKIERDHVISLALNGPPEWTGPRCQFHHQDKTNDDNRRVQEWRDRDPRANRANRSPDRRTMANTRPRSAATSRNRSAPPPPGPISVAIRAAIGLLIIAIAVLWFMGSLPEAIDRTVAIARAIAPHALKAAIAVAASALLGGIALWWRGRRKRARLEAIYRLTNAFSKAAKVAPDVIRIKARGWSHGVPVRGSAYYTETVDDEPGSKVREDVEWTLEHKLGLRLKFDWQHWRDTVYWWPDPETDSDAVDDELPADPAEPDAPPAPDPEREWERLQGGMAAVLGDGVEVEVTARHQDGTPQSIRVTYPSSAKVHDDKVVDAAEDKMTSMLEGRWRPEWDTKHDRVVFTDTPDPLADIVGLPPVEPGAPVDVLPCGRLEDGSLWKIMLDETPHLLIAGATGSGKGSVLWSIVRALLPGVLDGRAEIWAIDPKGMELARGRDIFTEYVVSPKAACELLKRAVAKMDERKMRLGRERKRTHVATPGDPKIFVIIDEIAALTSYGISKQLADEITGYMGLLTTQGRAIGVHLIAAVQDPRKEVLKIRDLFTGRAALRLQAAGEVDLVLGKGSRANGARSDKIPKNLPGIGYLVTDGKSDVLRYRAGWVDDPEIEAMEDQVVASRGGARNEMPAAPEPRVTPPAPEPDGWEQVGLLDLGMDEPARLSIDGELVEVTIVELVEAPDDDDVVEVTYRDADGDEAVIAYEVGEPVWRRTGE